MTRIAFIGGGIGGLAAAVALQQQGVDVHVHEQSPRLGEVGAGVSLTSNGVRALAHLGLTDALDEHAVQLARGMQRYRSDGTHVGGSASTSAPGGNVHRADLLQTLRDALDPARVHLGARAVAVEQDASGASVVFADGDRIRADAVVGADGIHSAVRSCLGEEVPPVFSGMVAYRALVPSERMPGWPLDEASMYLGEGRHFLVFPVRRRELLNVVAFVPTDDEMRESWSAPGDPARLRAAFAGWAPEVERLAAAVESCFRWGLYDREPLARWGEGRVTLLGDAAHAMLPHAGQGANQSLEDAVALGAAVAGLSADALPEGLAWYEEARRPRASTIQLFARRLGLEYDRRRVRSDDLDRRDDRLASNGEIEAWIKAHDAVREVRLVRDGAPDDERDLPPISAVDIRL